MLFMSMFSEKKDSTLLHLQESGARSGYGLMPNIIGRKTERAQES